MDKKNKGKFEKIWRRFINLDGLIDLSANGVKDITLCVIIILFLINVLKERIAYFNEWAILFFCIGILLVPIYYCSKWLKIIFDE